MICWIPDLEVCSGCWSRGGSPGSTHTPRGRESNCGLSKCDMNGTNRQLWLVWGRCHNKNAPPCADGHALKENYSGNYRFSFSTLKHNLISLYLQKCDMKGNTEPRVSLCVCMWWPDADNNILCLVQCRSEPAQHPIFQLRGVRRSSVISGGKCDQKKMYRRVFQKCFRRRSTSITWEWRVSGTAR